VKKWPYYVLLVRDYYSRKGRKGREGRLVIGDWETDCSRLACAPMCEGGFE